MNFKKIKIKFPYNFKNIICNKIKKNKKVIDINFKYIDETRPKLKSVITPIMRSKNINFNSVFLFILDLLGEISFDRSPNKIDGKKLLIIFARAFNKKYV